MMMASHIEMVVEGDEVQQPEGELELDDVV